MSSMERYKRVNDMNIAARRRYVGGESLKIHRSEVSLRLEDELQSRVEELRRFRIISRSAAASPILTEVLVEKTRARLKNVKSLEKKSLSLLERFRFCARKIQIICGLVLSLKKYEHVVVEKLTVYVKRDYPKWQPTEQDRSDNLSKSFKVNIFSCKLSAEMRQCLNEGPDRRTVNQKRKIRNFLRRYQLNTLFPKEKEDIFSTLVCYECYEKGRVIFLQGKPAWRFYFLFSGSLSKVTTIEPTKGIAKRVYEEVHPGSITDIKEVLQGSDRSYTLICKTCVEVLLLERVDILSLFEYSLPCGKDIMKSINVFTTYPLDDLFSHDNATKITFFAKGETIESNIKDSEYIYLVKSGSCKVLDKRAERCIDGIVPIHSAPLLHRRSVAIHSRRVAHSAFKQRTTMSDRNKMLLYVLERGNIYGLHAILPNVVKAIQSITTDKQLLKLNTFVPNNSADTILISNGAECLLIRKTAFLKYADVCTLSKILASPLNMISSALSRKVCGYDKNWTTLTTFEDVSYINRPPSSRRSMR